MRPRWIVRAWLAPLVLVALDCGSVSPRTPPDLGPPGPTPRLVSQDLVELRVANASQWPGGQAEVSIAVDRYDPARVVAAAMNLPDGRLLMMSSGDGGMTWSRALLPFDSGATLLADPMVAFDSRGRAYVAYIPVVNGDQNLGIDVSRSDDGGRSWSAALALVSRRNDDDKVALAVDDSQGSPYRDSVYVAWKRPKGAIYLSRSQDGGESFSRPRLLERAAVSGLDLEVSADGVVYLAANDRSSRSIRVLRSRDGGASFAPSVKVADVRSGFFTVPPSACVRRALVQTSLGVDRSAGAGRGTLYVSWADNPNGVSEEQCSRACDPHSPCTSNVYFSRSLDQGTTWSEPMTVHEDRSESSYFEYGDYQGLAVASRRLYAAWAEFAGPSAESQIAVASASFDGSEAGWTVALDPNDEWLLTSVGRVGAPTAANAYLYLVSPHGGSRRYLTPRGQQSQQPVAYMAFELSGSFSATIPLRREILGSEQGPTLLTAVLVPAAESADSPEDVASSVLKVAVADLVQGRPLGCVPPAGEAGAGSALAED